MASQVWKSARSHMLTPQPRGEESGEQVQTGFTLLPGDSPLQECSTAAQTGEQTLPLPPGTHLLCRAVEGSSVGNGVVACFLYPCLPKEGKTYHSSWLPVSSGLPNAWMKENVPLTEHSSGCLLPMAPWGLKSWGECWVDSETAKYCSCPQVTSKPSGPENTEMYGHNTFSRFQGSYRKTDLPVWNIAGVQRAESHQVHGPGNRLCLQQWCRIRGQLGSRDVLTPGQDDASGS